MAQKSSYEKHKIYKKTHQFCAHCPVRYPGTAVCENEFRIQRSPLWFRHTSTSGLNSEFAAKKSLHAFKMCRILPTSNSKNGSTVTNATNFAKPCKLQHWFDCWPVSAAVLYWKTKGARVITIRIKPMSTADNHTADANAANAFFAPSCGLGCRLSVLRSSPSILPSKQGHFWSSSSGNRKVLSELKRQKRKENFRVPNQSPKLGFITFAFPMWSCDQ